MVTEVKKSYLESPKGNSEHAKLHWHMGKTHRGGE